MNWFLENMGNIVPGLMVLAVAGIALYHTLNKKGSACGCGSDAGGCGGCAAQSSCNSQYPGTNGQAMQ